VAMWVTLGLALWAAPAHALTIQVTYSDGANEGFNDPTLGAARRAAFEHAADIWGAALAGPRTVVVDAAMNPLGGDGSGAVLGMAGATSVARDFSGAPFPSTWYPVALANQLADQDLVAGAEIEATFNGDVDNGVVLGGTDWYYGTDGNPGGDIDFVSVVLHELGHGLGFFDMVNQSTGAWLSGYPDAYGRNLFYSGVGQFPSLGDGQRLSALTSNNVRWNGTNVVNEAGGQVAIFAPSPYQSGSSISHFSTSLSPDELMEPYYTGASADPGLAIAALQDLGWQLGSGIPSSTTTTTTLTGGSSTSSTATTSTSTSTTMPPIDPFLCYKAKTTKKTPKFVAVSGVELDDEFESGTATVAKIQALCNPASDGGAMLDANTHFTSYALTPDGAHGRVELITVSDAFGSTVVDTTKVERLFVPSAKSLDAPPVAPDPAAHDVDHFKCYGVSVPSGAPTPYKGVEIMLQDQFTGTPRRFSLKKPRLLCNAVDKNGEGIKNEDGHLLCYKVKPAKGELKHQKRVGVYVANQFGGLQLDTKKEDLLCMPAVIRLLAD
jgi:hypothetical protein